MSVIVEIKEGSDTVGVLLPKVRTFKSGSRGFFGVTKAEIGGKRFQVQVQLVEIGSKSAGQVVEVAGIGDAANGDGL